MSPLRGHGTKDARRLSALRPSTREEQWQRVCRARDHIDSAYMQRLSLTELAHVACLSPHHFLRLFREAFGETPHRYLQRRRLEAAARRLREGHETVVQVALAVGFNDASAFSRAFRRRFGRPPTAERSRSGTARAARRS